MAFYTRTADGRIRGRVGGTLALALPPKREALPARVTSEPRWRASTIVLLGLSGWLAGLGPLFWPGLLLPAALLAWQIRALDVHDPALCLRLFKLNRETGLAIAAAILLGQT